MKGILLNLLNLNGRKRSKTVDTGIVRPYNCEGIGMHQLFIFFNGGKSNGCKLQKAMALDA